MARRRAAGLYARVACLVFCGCACAHPPQPAPSHSEALTQLIRDARTLELNGGRVRFIDTAETHDDPVPWVFVHGIAGRIEDFEDLLPIAAAEHRVVALDLPGFGLSSNPSNDFRLTAFVSTLRRFLDRLELGRVRLICHSMGGQVCVAFALDNPSSVVGLGLIDAAGTYDARYYTRDLAKRFAGLNLGQSQGKHNPVLALLGSDEDSVRGRVLIQKSVSSSALDSFRSNLRARISGLQVPAVLVWGMDDPIFPVEEAAFLHENIPHSRLHLIEGVGHVPFERHSPLIYRWLNAP